MLWGDIARGGEAFRGASVLNWAVHAEWVVELRYVPQLRALVSCSGDAKCALAIGDVIPPANPPPKSIKTVFHAVAPAAPGKLRTNPDQHSFSIRSGARTFDYSVAHNLVITGGLDRVLRLWNPYVTAQPTGECRGHYFPVQMIQVHDPTHRIFSLDTSGTVKVRMSRKRKKKKRKKKGGGGKSNTEEDHENGL